MSQQQAPAGWLHPDSPFHAGEQALQAKAGVRDKIETQGRRAVRDYLPEQHRAFYSLLPFILVGHQAADGAVWASVLAGPEGFITSPDPHTLRFAADPLPGDPLTGSLAIGQPLGLLGIQPHTRRRNRAHGVVADRQGGRLDLTIRQTVGNCPQYIQAREPTFLPDHRPGPVTAGTLLDDTAAALIRAADTFYIASISPEQPGAGANARSAGADVSHRGGKPGFVRINPDGTLTSPDFIGNFLFNTFGNLALDPRAGLTFIDHATGDVLYLTGTAWVEWEGPELTAFTAAERLLHFRPTRWILARAALPLRFTDPSLSPILDRTGDWQSVAQTLAAAERRDAWRPFRVARLQEEAAGIRSLYLEPADGLGILPHLPGQHLPIRLQVPGEARPLTRTYTISDAADGATYRLSVKAEGRASRALHALQPGAVIEAAAPRGTFTLQPQAEGLPIALISAGIGMTPMLAMLNSLLVNAGRSRHHGPILFLHGNRDAARLPFLAPLRDKASRHGNLTLHIALSEAAAEDVTAAVGASLGRIDGPLLTRLITDTRTIAHLCGPGPFMQAVYTALRGIGIPDAQIHAENFGPSALTRDRPVPVQPRVSPVAVPVAFSRSGQRLDWQPQGGTLLELAEAAGIEAAYSCRAGVCGTCRCRLTAGSVTYSTEPLADVGHDAILPCIARPAEGSAPLALDL